MGPKKGAKGSATPMPGDEKVGEKLSELGMEKKNLFSSSNVLRLF